MKLGQNFVKHFVHFWGNGVSRENAFEIYRPLSMQRIYRDVNMLNMGVHSVVFYIQVPNRKQE